MLPTPTATPYGNNQSPSADAAVRPSLDSLAKLLPTPRASDGEKGGPNQGGPNQRGSKGDLALSATVAHLLPTPRASDTGTPGRRASEGFRPPLSQVVLPLGTPLLPTPRTSDSNGGGSTVTEDPTSAPPSAPSLLPTPTANLATNGGTQHPAKRRAGGHQPSIADVIEHLGAATPPPSTGGNK
jgi:DNA (cytosine-5)-methyltransferase 1